MPNGGSDNCGTCWFNARNEGLAGHRRRDETLPHFCNIRGLALEDAFHTYCGNHPHRRPQGDEIPVGPVFVYDLSRRPPDPPGPLPAPPASHGRRFWVASPDTEEIRLHLLDLLGGILEEPTEQYPYGSHTDEIVVWQLGQFRDRRAIPHLERILGFSPEAGTESVVLRPRGGLIAMARAALSAIRTA